MIDGENTNVIDSGKTAVYFTIERDTVLNDPITSSLAEQPGTIRTWYGNDTRVIMRPCNGTLSFVLIHPSNETLLGRKSRARSDRVLYLTISRREQ